MYNHTLFEQRQCVNDIDADLLTKWLMCVRRWDPTIKICSECDKSQLLPLQGKFKEVSISETNVRLFLSRHLHLIKTDDILWVSLKVSVRSAEDYR